MDQTIIARTYRSLKTFCLAFIFLLAISNALAVDECMDEQPSDDIPCYIFLPNTNNCDSLTVDYYNGSIYLSTSQMGNQSPGICYSNFTYTTLGTYTFNYSTGDSGSIVVEEGNKMIFMMYFAMVLVIGLLLLGIYLNSQWILAIDGFMMLIIGFYTWVYGFADYNNMVSQIIGTIFIGMGGYFVIMSTLAMIEGDSE